MHIHRRWFMTLSAFFLCASLSEPAIAQNLTEEPENGVTNLSAWLIILGGMLMLLIATGFCLIEVGRSRAQNVVTVCLKTPSLLAIIGLMLWISGFNILYGGAGNHLLTPFMNWWFWTEDSFLNQVRSGAALPTDWIFHFAFVVLVIAMISGTLAERLKFKSLVIFAILFVGLIYPIQASWVWGGGYLAAEWQFTDLAGAVAVHTAGGWAALSGAMLLGPRAGKFLGNRIVPMPGSSIPLATVGTLLLWGAWIGLTGGLHLASLSGETTEQAARLFINLNSAACASLLVAMLLSNILYKKIDLTIVLNSAIGGLVAISAEPIMPELWQAAIIGGFAGVIVPLAVPLLYRFKIDDVIGAIPAHLFCGIWGTLVVVWTNNAATNMIKPPTFWGQLIGVLMVGGFVFAISSLIWLVLKYTIGIRIPRDRDARSVDSTRIDQ